jgi:hypothetical protein
MSTHASQSEMHAVSTTDPQQPATKQSNVPSIKDIFGDSAPLLAAEDLAHTGIFDDGEVEEFIADLYAMRRSDVAEHAAGRPCATVDRSRS